MAIISGLGLFVLIFMPNYPESYEKKEEEKPAEPAGEMDDSGVKRFELNLMMSNDTH